MALRNAVKEKLILKTIFNLCLKMKLYFNITAGS